MPAVSVIIATYNWSAALRCAIRSVRLQTVRDFEVLVIGDCCTDDSADVVASFDDPRIRWHNLPRNHGGQWVPNNIGIEMAAADHIAYLGHDDIWYPTHLASCLRAAQESAADLVAAVAILYGPPGSRERWVSGIFRNGVYAPSDFMPPSSILHRKSLLGGTGLWKDPATTMLPIDYELLQDACMAGARIEPTNELTTFKFNAAWRRDSYRVKSVDEQEALLQRIETGQDFRTSELTEVLRAVAEGRSKFLQIAREPKWASGETFRANRIFKGVEQQFPPDALRRLNEARRFTLEQTFPGFEWHELEVDQRHGSFRWSGPSTVSTVDVPVVIDRPLRIQVHVLHVLDANALAGARLLVNGEPVTIRHWMTEAGTWMFGGILRPGSRHLVDRAPRIAVELDRTLCPRDLGQSEDTRWLGIAVNWIEIAPVPYGWADIAHDAPGKAGAFSS